MDDYNRGGHSKYSMKVHLIFVTKYRKKIFMSDRRADEQEQEKKEEKGEKERKIYAMY